MERIAVLSDVHGNQEAFEAVLKALSAEDVRHIVHLGDLVGYNANPRECLQIARRSELTSVLGNHDLAILEPHTAEDFNVLAYQAIKYAQTQLTSPDLQYLETLPRARMLHDRYLICHGTPESIDSYILTLFQAKRVFNLLRSRFNGIRICFFGHTHVQKLWLRDPRGKVTSVAPNSPSFSLDPECMYLINPGSVGQPRQHDNRAHYLIFDSINERVSFKTVPYDISKAQHKIRQARLPDYLAARLQDGI